MGDRDIVELVVRLPPELHEALKARAKADDRSMAAVIRTALRRYVAAHDQDHRVLWEQDTRPTDGDPSKSYIAPPLLDCPPGTHVAIVARKANP